MTRRNHNQSEPKTKSGRVIDRLMVQWVLGLRLFQRVFVSSVFACCGFVLSVVASTFLDAQEIPFQKRDSTTALSYSQEDQSIEADVQPPEKVVYQWPQVDRSNFLKSMSEWSKPKQPASEHLRAIEELEAFFKERSDRTRGFVKWISHIDPQLGELIEAMRNRPNTVSGADLEKFDNKWIRTQLQLYHALRLAKASLHDESASVLRTIEKEFLIDPGTYFFYLGICDRQLIQIESSKGALLVLLRHEEEIPLRYHSLAAMMLADLENHKPNSLSEVSRLMGDAQRRQALARQTDKVLEQEDEIVKTLDKVIDGLERQKQKMQAASDSKSRPSGGQQSKPRQTEAPPSGQNAKGIVDSKEQSQEGEWGSLEGNSKSIAVKNLVRDLPPHYRTLIEAYFQKLAEEKND